MVKIVCVCKILVADRNRHVREFLRRELSAEGYRVDMARDAREVLQLLEGPDPPDLLILDLELPYVNELDVLERLEERSPALPVVIHSFQPDNLDHFPIPRTCVFLEKEGDPDLLKEVVADLILQQKAIVLSQEK